MRKRWRSPCGMPHPAWKLSCNTAFCRNWTSSPEALCSGIPAHPLWFCRRQPACVWTCRTATWEWMHFHGRHAMERMPERTALFHGVQESSSARGTSSHQQNPSVVLCAPDCTEQNGSCIGAFLMYSGSFQTQIEL
ncbi:MAG: glycoside hydrolase family 36 N-terminal domain-containing protein [Ruminococcus sp.]